MVTNFSRICCIKGIICNHILVSRQNYDNILSIRRNNIYSQQDFNQEVFTSIKKKIGRQPTDEECKAVAHHMEYNIWADKNFANNGYLTINRHELRKRIIWQIKQNLHSNDIPRYAAQYQKYKELQKYCLLTQPEKNDIVNIATGRDLAQYSSSEQIKYLSPLLEKFRAAKPPQNFQDRSNNLSL